MAGCVIRGSGPVNLRTSRWAGLGVVVAYVPRGMAAQSPYGTAAAPRNYSAAQYVVLMRQAGG